MTLTITEDGHPVDVRDPATGDLLAAEPQPATADSAPRWPWVVAGGWLALVFVVPLYLAGPDDQGPQPAEQFSHTQVGAVENGR